MAFDSDEADAGAYVLLDACCVLNLYATGCMAEILVAVGARFGVASAVEREALWVFAGGEGDDGAERAPVDLQPLIQAGLLEVLELDSDEELNTFVSFATLVDDGEAATIALALHRGAVVATDDRKTLRELRKSHVPFEPWTTAGLLHAWAVATDAAPARVDEVLQAVRRRARFEPNRVDELSGWWERQIREGTAQG